MCRSSRRGALIIEYALLFAFVSIVGVIMINPELSGSIKNIFTKSETVLDAAAKATETPEEKRNKVFLNMKEALESALEKAKSAHPDKTKLFDYLDSNQIGNNALAAEMDTYVREHLASQGVNPNDVAYWSIDKHDKAADGPYEAYNGYRFAWSSFNPKDYSVGEAMPVIQYTRHDKPGKTSEYIDGCNDHSTVAHWEYQVGEKKIVTGNKINWDTASTEHKYAVFTAQDAVNLYNERYMTKK